MAQDATTLGFTGTFDFKHLIALEAHKPWMGKVKRNGKAQHSLGREELFRQPHMRESAELARHELPVKPSDPSRHQCVLEAQGEVAKAYCQKRLVRRIFKMQRGRSASAMRGCRAHLSVSVSVSYRSSKVLRIQS